ncbi:MAG TPA: alpha/beta hydrolase [Thermoanaerobaculia bacterium]|nr:alpha/beta hydrolase [Thermoanaerobaculia bacterium]
MRRAVVVVAILLAAQARAGTHGFVAANGVRLSYIDWGGRGEPLLLLAGMSDHAGIYEPFAPRFTDRFHVLALTRRGFGQSDKPAAGYDLNTRVEDIRAFLDAMKIRRVHLVGHSAAGDELTLFATRYPDRVRKLVYLDAAYDRYHLLAMMAARPGAPPWVSLPREVPANAPPALADPKVWRAFVACMKSGDEYRIDYRGVRAPALAIYAVPRKHPLGASGSARIRSSIEQFRREMRGGKVIELIDADHHLFLGSTEDRVVAEMRAFLRV